MQWCCPVADGTTFGTGTLVYDDREIPTDLAFEPDGHVVLRVHGIGEIPAGSEFYVRDDSGTVVTERVKHHSTTMVVPQMHIEMLRAS